MGPLQEGQHLGKNLKFTGSFEQKDCTKDRKKKKDSLKPLFRSI
jgi:hypothetical protein